MLSLFGLVVFYFVGPAFALETLSYSGRLVQANGAPVTGPVTIRAELAYTNDLSATGVLCTQDIAGVALTNGVFHVKLNLNCTDSGTFPSRTLTQVLSQAPAGETVAIRITDLSHSKAYSYQALHSLPYASVASQLVQMGAGDGQALVWKNSSKSWEPGAVAAGGTVTSVSVNSPLSISNPATTPSIAIAQANSTTNGYLSSADWNTFNSKQGALPAGGTSAHYYRGDNSWQTLDSDAVPEGALNLYFTNARVLGLPLTGFAPAAGAIVATDTVLEGFSKTQGQINSLTSDSSHFLKKDSADTLSSNTTLTGVVDADTVTGDIRVRSPLGMTSAVNKSYVDAGDALKVNKAGDTVNGVLTLDNDLKIKGGSNYVTVKGHATSAAYNLFLPSTAGTAGYVLSTDGSGNTSWINPSLTVAGSGTVNSASITDGSIVDADINASAGIAQSKIANLTTDLAGKQPLITAGTTSQYYRGDKTFVDLATDVRGTALTGFAVGANSAIVAADTTLGAFQKVQGQINATNTAVAGKEPSITAGITSQYYRGDKTFVDLGTDVRAIALTGFAVGANSAVVAADTTLGAFQKMQGQINATNTAIAGKESTVTAGTTSQYYRGDKTFVDLATDVRGTALTGFAVGANSAIVAADTTLGAFQKVQGQINATNTAVAGKEPSLAAGTASQYYSGNKTWQTLNGSAVANTAAGNIAATNVQLALNELDTEKQANITSSSAITSGSVTTSLQNGVNVNPFGAAVGNTGELRFYELTAGGTNYTSLKAPDALAADINYILPSVAPTAGQVLSSNASGVMSWLTIPSAPVTTVFGRTGAVVATAGDYTATQITNTAAGSIAATNVQTALNELDTEKQSLITAGTTAQYYRGDKTFVDFGTDVRGAPLTGFAVGANSAVLATDTTLGAFQKVQGQINATNTAVAGKEPAITAGTTAQYIRGDKTLSTFATDAINSVLSTFALNVGAKPTVATTDSVVGAFGKVQKFINDINSDYVSKTANQTINGTLAINSATGFITVPTPINPNDAANKAYVDGFGQWLENGANIYFNTGNVGIGTNSPEGKLHVESSSLNTSILMVGDRTNANASSIYFERRGADLTAPINVQGSKNGVGPMDITLQLQGGNVGIGTVSPTAKLDIAGGNLNFDIANGLTSDAGAALKTGPAGLTWQVYPGDASAASFIANNFNGTTALIVTNTGHVGIASTNPGTLTGWSPNPAMRVLEITGDGSNVANSDGIISLTNNRPIPASGDQLGAILFGSKLDPGGIHTGIAAYSSGAGGANGFGSTLEFSTKADNVAGNVNRMMINSAGNVGIGTTNPGRMLHVVRAADDALSGDVALAQFDRKAVSGTPAAGITGYLQLGLPNSSNSVVLAADIGARLTDVTPGAEKGVLILRTTTAGGASEKMRIDHTGNVGIGNSNPKAKLEVNGAAVIGNTYGGKTIGVASYFTGTSSAALYIHIKTPFRPQFDTGMYHFKVEGYAYADSRDIDLTYVGYSYPPAYPVIQNVQSRDPQGVFAPTQYLGSDGYIYLRFKPGNTYYLTIRVDSTYVGNGRVIYPGEMTITESAAATL